MRLAVSNIAWPADEEPEVADAMAAAGLDAVEIAPTKTFADPLATTPEERSDYLAFWEDRGIDVVAFQSMLFGRLDLTLFDDRAVTDATIDHLTRFIELAGQLGAGVLVFGSPKNRRVPEGMEPERAFEIAVDAFGRLGEAAQNHGTLFCIEPNPIVYDCNFVTDAASGLELVRAVGHPGFKLHLDAAGMTLAGDDLAASIAAADAELCHFHASAPQLGELEREAVDHASAADALRRIGYTGLVSIEMRPGGPGEGAERVRRATALASEFYAD